MKILVACEYSGIVREAFTAKGHDVTSCDLLPTEIPGKHYQGDVMDIINDGWDMMIAFPPCTHLAASGAQYWNVKIKDGRLQAAMEFVVGIYHAGVEKVAIENPVGILSTWWVPPDQYIQPYQHGDPYRKKTGLWLKELPLLTPTEIVEPVASWSTGSHRSGPGKDGVRNKSKLPALHSGAKHRSKTFPGIAAAMAAQWG